ncbi:hypothetical protein Q5752_005865 [Cryptotrichosporon argae]
MPESAATVQALVDGFLSQGYSLCFTPYLLGLIIDAFCLGAILCQVVEYYNQSWATDRVWVRALIVYHSVASSVESGYVVWFNLRLFGLNFGNPVPFVTNAPYYSWFFVFDTLSRTPTAVRTLHTDTASRQLFFVTRAYYMTGRSRAYLVPAIVLPAAAFVGAVGVKAQMTKVDAQIVHAGGQKLVQADEQHATPALLACYGLWFFAELSSDLLTTGASLWALWKSRRERRHRRSTWRVALLVAGSQLPPTLLSLAFFLIVFITARTPILMFFIFLPKTYVLSMLAVLNSRGGLRHMIAKEDAASLQRGLSASRQSRTPAPYGPHGVLVTTETYTESVPMQALPQKISVNRTYRNSIRGDDVFATVELSQALDDQVRLPSTSTVAFIFLS